MAGSHQNHDELHKRIQIDQHIGLIDANDAPQQQEMIMAGCLPVGILPVGESWFIKFFKGEAPPVIYQKTGDLMPGISPIYCSDIREFEIINSISNEIKQSDRVSGRNSSVYA